MAPHSSTLAWKIPWTEEPGSLQSMGRSESDTTERLHFHFSLSCIGEGNAIHSSVLAWRIPGTGEPGGLPSVGLHRVRHNWSDLATMKNSMDIPQEVKSRVIWSSIPTAGHIPEFITIYQRNICTLMFTAALFTIAKVWKLPICL